jgi:hypothetical protein
MLAQTLLFSLIGSLGAIAGSALLLSGKRRRESLLPAFINYAIAMLLGAAFHKLRRWRRDRRSLPRVSGSGRRHRNRRDRP